MTISPTSVYRRHLGAAFDQLPQEVRRFHELAGTHRLQGRVDVQGPQSAFGRMIGRLFRLPETGSGLALDFEVVADEQAEIWTRMFPGRHMRSRLSVHEDYLVEDFGPIRLWFQIDADATQLSMLLRRLTLFGIPLPKWIWPRVRAIETATPGCIHFEVASWFPADKLIVAYKGYLVVPTPAVRA